MVVDFCPPADNYFPIIPHFSFECSVLSALSVLSVLKTVNMVSVVNRGRERVEVIGLVG